MLKFKIKYKQVCQSKTLKCKTIWNPKVSLFLPVKIQLINDMKMKVCKKKKKLKYVQVLEKQKFQGKTLLTTSCNY